MWTGVFITGTGKSNLTFSCFQLRLIAYFSYWYNFSYDWNNFRSFIGQIALIGPPFHFFEESITLIGATFCVIGATNQLSPNYQ